MKKVLRHILLEMIPVLVGVLAALFINNWKETRTQQRYMETVSVMIDKQIRSNREDLAQTIARKEVILDSLTTHISTDKTVIEILQQTKGITVASVQTSSWQALLNFKLELVDYKLVAQLSLIDEEKQILQLKTDKMLDFLYENLENPSQQHKRIFILMLQNMLESEYRLLEMHETYLEEFSSK